MLKSKRKVIDSMQKQEILYQKSNVLKWVETSLSKINYSLSDASCNFYVNQIVRQNNNCIITVEMYVQPLIGIFKDIQFRPKMYINSENLIRRPKIYNDRRIYHPNINVQTIQIAFPQICQQWNPAKQLELTLSSLKYAILQPITSFVHNNPFNKQIALCYKFQRTEFRNLIVQNGPAYLEDLIAKQKPDRIQKNWHNYQNQREDQSFLDIQQFFPKKISFKNRSQNSYKRTLQPVEQELHILQKQIKKIKVNSDVQNYESQNQYTQIQIQ